MVIRLVLSLNSFLERPGGRPVHEARLRPYPAARRNTTRPRE